MLHTEAFAASKPHTVKAVRSSGARLAPQRCTAVVTNTELLRCADIVARQLVKPCAFPTPGHLLRALASDGLDEEQLTCLS